MPRKRNRNQLVQGGNFSGFAWGENVNQINPPTIEDIDNAIKDGFTSLRLAFDLRYAHNGNNRLDLNSSYVKQYFAYAREILKRDLRLILDIHNFMRLGGTNPNDGPILTIQQCKEMIGEDFINLLLPLYKEFGKEKVIFEAMNEPHDMGNESLVARFQAIINAARAQGYDGTILVAGSAWSSTRIWTNSDGSGANQFTEFLPLFNKNNCGDVQLVIHTYFNSPYGGGDGLTECVTPDDVLTINCIPELTELARKHNIQIWITEVGVKNTPRCLEVLETAMDHYNQNPDVFKEYDWWVLSPSKTADWGPNGYPLLINTHNDARLAILQQDNIPAPTRANNTNGMSTLAISLAVGGSIMLTIILIVLAAKLYRYYHPVERAKDEEQGNPIVSNNRSSFLAKPDTKEDKQKLLEYANDDNEVELDTIPSPPSLN